MFNAHLNLASTLDKTDSSLDPNAKLSMMSSSG
jgi:hypothetical protein